MEIMHVTDGAKYCSRGSEVDQIAMSTRKDQKELPNEEPTSSGTGTSHSKECQCKKAIQLARPKSKMAAAKVKDKSWKSQPFSTRNRRAPLVDAATAPAPIDVEEDVACIRRELPPVDAAKSPSEGGEAVPNSGDDVRSVPDSELTDVVDTPEATLEEELLREVGLSVTNEP